MEKFTRIANQVLLNLDLTGPDILVYLALSKYADNKTGKCYPSLTTIEAISRLSRMTVVKSLSRLSQEDLVKIDRTRGQVNRYQLTST